MRRRSRECALQILYQLDLDGRLDPAAPPSPQQVGEALTAFWLSFEGDPERRRPVDRALCERLVRGTASDLPALDRAIGAASQRWRVERMALVDRNLLRMAAYEILRCPDIPPNVSINEAIEIAKRFSGQDAASFVNGVLDHVARSGGGDAGAEPSEAAE